MRFVDTVAAPEKGRPAPKTITLTPDQFADEYGNRPVAPVVFGIRVPSEADLQAARNEASKLAAQVQDADSAIATYNDTLLAICVARGLCSQHDVTKPHPFLELADDMVPVALKSRTIRSIYDEIERLHVEQSPLYPELDDEAIGELRRLLDDGALAKLSPVNQRYVRRYLGFCLDLIRNV